MCASCGQQDNFLCIGAVKIMAFRFCSQAIWNSYWRQESVAVASIVCQPALAIYVIFLWSEVCPGACFVCKWQLARFRWISLLISLTSPWRRTQGVNSEGIYMVYIYNIDRAESD